MSHYGKYISEREGKQIVEKENGFATFKIYPETKLCYLADIYVERAYRKTGLCFQMADEIAEIAKKEGCETLIGSIDTKANSVTESMSVLIAYGFKFNCIEGSMLYFSKGL